VELVVLLADAPPSGGTTNEQKGALQTAPRPLHLQSESFVHHPLSPEVASTQAAGVTFQLHTWVPHAVPPAVQSMSFVQARAGLVHAPATVTANAIAKV
jgi:hypothetical protein